MILKLDSQKSDVQEPARNVEPPSARRAAFELVVLLAMLEWVLWTGSKHVLPEILRVASGLVLLAVVVALAALQRPSRSSLGLAPASWWRGCEWLAAFTCSSIAIMGAIGTWTGTLGNVEHLGRWVWRTWHIEGMQQLLLQVLLVPRLAVLMTGPAWRISVAAGLVFSLLHLPNLPLTALTLIAGVFWCEWFRRFKNLPALWLSHVLLAAAALYTLNGSALRMLRVGIGYLYYDR
jgi:hypothetical protein